MRLIDADEFKENVLNGLYIYLQVNKEDIARAIDDAPTVAVNFKDCIKAGTLKARDGDYVLYKVDFLLDNLTREVYIMEGARRMRGKEE